jgi:hypothetical protein
MGVVQSLFTERTCANCDRSRPLLEFVERELPVPDCSTCRAFLAGFAPKNVLVKETYADRDFTPLCQEGLRNAFAGTFRKVAFKEPLTLLSRVQAADGSLGAFFSAEAFVLRNHRLDYAIAQKFQADLSQQKYLLVPPTVYALDGTAAPQTCPVNGCLPGGGRQIVLPPEVVAALREPSLRFMAGLVPTNKGKINPNAYWRWRHECSAAEAAQDAYWQAFEHERAIVYHDVNLDCVAAALLAGINGGNAGKALAAARKFDMQAASYEARLDVEQRLRLDGFRDVLRATTTAADLAQFKMKVFELLENFAVENTDGCPHATFGRALQERAARLLALIAKTKEAVPAGEHAYVDVIGRTAAAALCNACEDWSRGVERALHLRKRRTFDELVHLINIVADPARGSAVAKLPRDVQDVFKSNGRKASGGKLEADLLKTPLVAHREEDLEILVTFEFVKTVTRRQGNDTLHIHYYNVTVTARPRS